MVSQCDESLIWVVTSFELIIGQNELQLTRNLFVVKFVAGQEFVARYGTKRGVRRCVRHDEKNVRSTYTVIKATVDRRDGV